MRHFLLMSPTLTAMFAAMLVLGPSSFSQTIAQGKFIEVVVHARTLENNGLADSPDRKVAVYLPPAYESRPAERFPVLYHLHGYSLHSVLGDWVAVFQEAMDTFIAKNPSKQLIVVIPDGFNAVGGSFWINSSVEGGWEDFVSSELPRYIDEHYRTINNRNSRAISGHSMGGFAALRMGELHSEMFSVVYAFSPCCTDFIKDMTSENSAWRQVLQLKNPSDIHRAMEENQFWTAALAAFAIATSPDPKAAVKADFPYVMRNGKMLTIHKTMDRWYGAMPDHLVPSHVPNLKSLRGLAFDYGLEDGFTHIPAGADELTHLLEKNGIPFLFESYHGDHNSGVPVRVGTRLLPFMAEKLVFDNVKQNP